MGTVAPARHYDTPSDDDKVPVEVVERRLNEFEERAAHSFRELTLNIAFLPVAISLLSITISNSLFPDNPLDSIVVSLGLVLWLVTIGASIGERITSKRKVWKLRAHLDSSDRGEPLPSNEAFEFEFQSSKGRFQSVIRSLGSVIVLFCIVFGPIFGKYASGLLVLVFAVILSGGFYNRLIGDIGMAISQVHNWIEDRWSPTERIINRVIQYVSPPPESARESSDN